MHPLKVFYNGEIVGEFRTNIIVEDKKASKKFIKKISMNRIK
jgi:hypothetical protein